MTTKKALENQIDRLLSSGYGGSDDPRWIRANRELDILEQALKMLEAAEEEINEKSIS